MSKQHYGRCALCGKEGKLTFEHIPPQAAFNKGHYKCYSGIDILTDDSQLPWELDGRKNKIQQKGAGGYTLCQSCNNLTGALYGNAYMEMAHIGVQVLHDAYEKKPDAIGFSDIYVSRFAKQVLSFFCSINNDCVINAVTLPQFMENPNDYTEPLQVVMTAQTNFYCAAQIINELRQFVLDKDAICLDRKKFRLCMYFYAGSMQISNSISAKTDIINNTTIVLSEVTAYPFGFILYINPTENQPYDGIDITSFTDYGYDDKCTFEMKYMLLERNSNVPGDYRTKEQIFADIKSNQQYYKTERQ